MVLVWGAGTGLDIGTGWGVGIGLVVGIFWVLVLAAACFRTFLHFFNICLASVALYFLPYSLSDWVDVRTGLGLIDRLTEYALG